MRRIASGLLVVTLVACAIDAALEQVTPAIDLWWHLATGRHIVEHLEIPRYDVFSYTNEGARWFNHEWLSQVLFFTLFRLGGGTALAVFKILAVVSFVLVAARLAWWRSASLLFSVAAAGAAAVLCRPFLDIRPDLFLFVGTMTVMAIVGAHRRGAPPAVLALLPAVIALWVNLHSSFIYGLGLIGLLAGTETAKAALGFSEDRLPPDRAWRLALAAAAAGLACLLNPERLGALAFPFAILKPEAAVWRDRIVERGSAWRYLAFQLLYPDVPRAQFFLGLAYLDGPQFERARLHLTDLLRRFPSGASIVREAEERALATARSGDLPAAWFAVGLFREVLGDGPGAVQSYATAVERGIAEPDASYARAAVERLGAARP